MLWTSDIHMQNKLHAPHLRSRAGARSSLYSRGLNPPGTPEAAGSPPTGWSVLPPPTFICGSVSSGGASTTERSRSGSPDRRIMADAHSRCHRVEPGKPPQQWVLDTEQRASTLLARRHRLNGSMGSKATVVKASLTHQKRARSSTSVPPPSMGIDTV